MEYLQDILYFRTLAKTENMTQAARELYISQPNLSRAMTRLEKSLGVSLFDRRRGSIRLNETGRAYLTYVDTAFQALEEGRRHITGVAEMQIQLTTLASPYHSLATFLASRLREEDTAAQGLTTYICQEKAALEMVRSGEADFGLACVERNAPGLAWDAVSPAPVCMIAGKDHPLAGREAVTLSDLRREQIIIVNEQEVLVSRLQTVLDRPILQVNANDMGPTASHFIERKGCLSAITLHEAYMLFHHEPDIPPVRLLRLAEPLPAVELGIFRGKGRALSPFARRCCAQAVAAFRELDEKAAAWYAARFDAKL